ncbi:hypothetical protein CEUSTIGMA_g9383.t1 [Chlamydomonas eustigma]|uniref:Uncharacterized protein n=1 Tax=Chlamydomonas eustigma TaxID=1157962 RepID=A0A250XFU8_9CHLO|nr:hypothetical protein CEUSTIGMA_g9383.t1 [Chlamydomonas eustigma]|eukprot:GAX81955.1 hypothetical protein CEUSTIGMA_g9383.t1 [Chlamydomonas eustigma]
MRNRSLQQFFALYRKNALIAWRNIYATLLRLIIAPFLFLILALLIDKALQANSSTTQQYQNVPNPSPQLVGPIPSCHSDMYIGSNYCTEILYAPSNGVTQAIMDYVVANNSIPITATAYASYCLCKSR